MEKISLVGLDQDLFYEELSNGLKVYLVPYKNKNNYSVHYVTRFGSVDTSFVPIEKEKMEKVPDGIAHFLEHKMFESEDGIDPFTFYSKTGTNCNASTSYYATRYLFEGTQNFEENLEYLLNFVNSPYFTDENVEKEKGIIAEEINMYTDDPEWQLDEEIRKAIFHVDPYRIDIAGEVEDIYSITKEHLYDCYNTFYAPNNMFIVATGNIDPERTLEIIKNNKKLQARENPDSIIRKKYDEPLEVNKKELEFSANIENTKAGLSFKLAKNEDYNEFEYDIYTSAILNILFGSSSEFREEMRNQKLLTRLYNWNSTIGNYHTINFIAESDKPKELMMQVIEALKTRKVEKEDLERMKKVWISSEVAAIDNNEATLDNIVSDIIKYKDIIPNKTEIIRKLNIETLTEIRNSWNLDNYSLVIMNKK